MNVLPSADAHVDSDPGISPTFPYTSRALRALSIPGESLLIVMYFTVTPPSIAAKIGYPTRSIRCQ
jgi:hypothetical protein